MELKARSPLYVSPGLWMNVRSLLRRKTIFSERQRAAGKGNPISVWRTAEA